MNDQVPGNVWFQFWLYTNYYDDPEDKEEPDSAGTGAGKFIYPSPDGSYPTYPRWLFGMGAFEPRLGERRGRAVVRGSEGRKTF